MKRVFTDLFSGEKHEIYIKEDTAKTVGELIELLSTIPKDYRVSLCGFCEYAIAVDDTDKSILIDDAKWIDECVYLLIDENRE